MVMAWVAVWRELRRTGAVSIGQSAWLAPSAPGRPSIPARTATYELLRPYPNQRRRVVYRRSTPPAVS
jgi:hypothetical protein